MFVSTWIIIASALSLVKKIPALNSQLVQNRSSSHLAMGFPALFQYALHVLERQCKKLLYQTFYPFSVFQPGFREWLPGVPPKQAEIAWDEILNQFYVGCSNTIGSQHPCHYESCLKLCLSIALTYYSLVSLCVTLLSYAQ